MVLHAQASQRQQGSSLNGQELNDDVVSITKTVEALDILENALSRDPKNAQVYAIKTYHSDIFGSPSKFQYLK